MPRTPRESTSKSKLKSGSALKRPAPSSSTNKATNNKNNSNIKDGSVEKGNNKRNDNDKGKGKDKVVENNDTGKDIQDEDADADVDMAGTIILNPSEEKERYIRITTHGKMKAWIRNSLAFFEDVDQERSIIFHTLPRAVDPFTHPQASPITSLPLGPLLTTTALPPLIPPPPPTITITPHTASGTTALIPRLLSVVEIIKREFMKQLEETRSPRMKGLEQYNELGALEGLGVRVSEGADGEGEGGEAGGGGEAEAQEKERAERQRSEMILQALSGRNHPRQSQTPYMRITLSLVERPDLVERGATYQPPAKRKLSRSGKARAKKRAKKALALEEANLAVVNLTKAKEGEEGEGEEGEGEGEAVLE